MNKDYLGGLSNVYFDSILELEYRVVVIGRRREDHSTINPITVSRSQARIQSAESKLVPLVPDRISSRSISLISSRLLRFLRRLSLLFQAVRKERHACHYYY